MKEKQGLRFGPYYLDPENAQLWRGKKTIPLTHKAFGVLCYLAERPGQLVTKEELLTALWPETYVSEATLTVCVGRIRKALRERALTPRCIETVHRRGYRFIATVQKSSDAQSPSLHLAQMAHMVGREPELAQLRSILERALRGERQVVFVTGEAGIGKTTVVEAFVHQVQTYAKQDGAVWLGQGQCIEQYGPGEAYLPILEALARLCRGPEGQRLISLLGQHAPTWLVQMPTLVSAEELQALQRQVMRTSKEKMLREMAEVVAVLTAERPLVLIIEDLHWSDVSTLDLLTAFARRPEPARLLVLGTYRPVDVIIRDHPLKAVKQELQMHQQCEELLLGYLSEEAVQDYLMRRFALGAQQAASLPQLARFLHERTEGNPLFMVTLVDELVEQAQLVQADAGWELRGKIEDVERSVPASLQQLLDRQIGHLGATQQRLLEVASVAGMTFSTATLATGVDQQLGRVEEACEDIVRHSHLIEWAGVGEWPDGTVASHYRFVHALYQEVLYESLAEGRRVQLHRQMAQRLEAGYGERAGEIAGELALHFEEGRLAPKAIEYHHQAGQAALRRNAPQEAIGHLQTGLGLVAALADTPERRQQELALQMTLSIPLLMTHGYTAPAVEQVYDRAFVLCQQLEETPQLFSVLHGIQRFHIVRGDLNRGLELGQQLLKIAKDAQDPALLIEAHAHMGGCLVLRGEFAQCRTHEEQCLALFEPHQHDDLGFVYGDDPKALSLAHLARALWYLGYPDQAAQRSQESLARAQEQTNRMTEVVAHVSASYLRLIRREEQLSRTLLDAVRTTATTEGFAMFHMWDTISHGWTLIEHSSLQNGQDGQKGIAQIQDGLATLRRMGVGNHVTTCLLLLAMGYLKSGQIREGLNAVAETFTVMQKGEERESEAELHRLKGELLSKQAQGKRQQAKIAVEIEGCYQKALEIARSQHAKSLELRAAMSLSRWWTEQDRREEAYQVLADVYNWFTEGFGTRDLQEAKALLSQLGGAPSHRLKKKKTTRRTRLSRKASKA